MNKVKAIYPGTFDPITLGHLNIIHRASSIFDLTVAISGSSKKNIYFNLEDRIKMTKEVLGNGKLVNVVSFNGLLIELAKKLQIKLLIRGIRSSADIKTELQLSSMNKNLDSEYDLETIFMTSLDKYSNISSTIVKQIASLNGDISNFVPKQVQNYFDHNTKN